MEILDTLVGEVIIREALVKDAPEAVEFMNWVTGEVDFHTYGANDFSIKPEDEERMISSFNSRDNSIFILALLNNEIIGIATLSGGLNKKTKHKGMIGITISKRYWRLGIGYKMMNTLISFAYQNSILTKLDLLVHENNYGAIELYKKLNFLEEARIKKYFKLGNDYFDGIRMGLVLDE